MIRWGYLIPRLILVAAVAALLGFGLAPLLRWSIVTYGSKALGARIDIETLNLSLARVDLELGGIQVANPAAPAKNLLRATRVQLDLDRDALLQRRLVVRDGRISGLRLDDMRSSSGALPEDGSGDLFGSFDEAAFRKQWLMPIAGRLREDLESELMTPGLCRELMDRWPDEYRRMEAEIDTLKDRVDRLKKLVREVRESKAIPNPERIQQTATELAQTRSDLERMPSDVRRMGEQVKQDAKAMREAKDHDVAYLRSKLSMESLSGQTLTHYLLGREQASRLQELLAWVQWSRKYIPHRREFAEPERLRGRTIRFGDARPSPQVLFERLAVEGDFRDGGQYVPFAGTVTDVSTQPALHGRPATVVIEARGEAPLRVSAILDRTGATPHDHLMVDLPSLDMPARKLGRAEELALAVAPGRAAVKLEIDLRDDSLAGQLVYAQKGVRLETALAASYGGDAVQARVNQALQEIQQLSVTVDLSGTLRRPSARLHSDLGPQLAEGLNTAVRQELQMRVDQLTSRINREVTEQLGKLDQLVSAQSNELLARLNVPRAELEKLTTPMAGQWNLDQLSKLPPSVRTGQLPKRPQLPVGDLLTR